MSSRKRGYTLAELLITLAILGILTAIATTAFKKCGTNQTPDDNVEYHGH